MTSLHRWGVRVVGSFLSEEQPGQWNAVFHDFIAQVGV